MSNMKRDRCVNWETEEKQLLKQILKPYINVIENKDLTTNTNKAKLKAWGEIVQKFNVVNFRPRDKKQLINQWKLLKLHSKKVSQYSCKMYKTGGGPKPASPPTEIMDIVEMIPHEFEVDTKEFDCDGVEDISQEILYLDSTGIQDDSKSDMNIVTIKLEDNEENLPEVFLPTSEVDITPKQPAEKKLKTSMVYDEDGEQNIPESCPSSSKFFVTPKQSGKKKSVSKNNETFNFGEASFEDMHKFRVLENERLQKEHELRMKNMAEQHSQFMTNLKLQAQLYAKALENFNKK